MVKGVGMGQKNDDQHRGVLSKPKHGNFSIALSSSV
jgi:hypothetical protein